LAALALGYKTKIVSANIVKTALYDSANVVSLDTLAQLPPKSGYENTRGVLLKRARAKYHTQKVVLGLVDTGSELNQYYWNAYHCCDTIKQSGKEFTSTYCNTRICHVCNRIRTAKLMKGYLPQLKNRKLDFVTLTIPNVKKEELKGTITEMIKTATLIIRNMREKKSLSVNGIRKIEVTYNKDSDTYHPHFHLLVDNGAEEILSQWLKRYPTAKRIAQDIRPADQNSLNELFKYSTKIIEGKQGKNIEIYCDALNTIMISLKGKRIFQPFGEIRKVSEEIEQLDVQEIEDAEPTTEIWHWNNHDWFTIINPDKIPLTEYKPPPINFRYIGFLHLPDVPLN
jgi:hypothetical protein